MKGDKSKFYFNNQKKSITDPIMYSFAGFYNLIDWAKEELYEWSNKNMKEKRLTCGINEIISYKGDYLELCFNSSLALHIYAILEDGLKRISDFYQSEIQSDVKINHFKFDVNDPSKSNSNLKKYASYLEALGIHNAIDNNYKMLEKWTLVRNFITHSGEEIRDKNKVEAIKDIVKIDYTFDDVSSYSFAIDFQAVELFASTVEEYLSSIFNYEIPNLMLKNRL